MTATSSPQPRNQAPVSYYAFGQRADRLVALAFGYDGSVRPMKRAAAVQPASPAGAWNDVGGAMNGIQAPAGSILPLSATVPDGNSALVSIEFSGWSLPYPPHIANILGPSWPCGQTEVNYSPAASVGNVQCLKKIDFEFAPKVDAAGNKTATLTWTTGTAPVTGKNSVSLDANSLKFTYVVVRVNGTNNGQLSSVASLGNDAAGNPVRSLST